MHGRGNPHGQFYGSHGIDGILPNQERKIYELVHFLVCETDRLRGLVLEARRSANALAALDDGLPYPEIWCCACGASFEDHPAMVQYNEIYKEEVPF